MTFLTHEDPSMQREKAGYTGNINVPLLLVSETMERIPRAVFLTSCPDNHDLSPYKLAKIAIQAHLQMHEMKIQNLLLPIYAAFLRSQLEDMTH